ncbi:MAG: class I SAM-dependent methyltransferase [Nitrospinota bacterium]|nr:class I SAM-dependent methyltransferase [Nitrospinota bacterium]
MRTPHILSSRKQLWRRAWAFLLFGTLTLSGCFVEGPPAHSVGHQHKHAGTEEGAHLRYQEPDRYTWQYPDKVVKALKLEPGMKVADLGSGTGYFTFRLAEAVGDSGKVYAIDINKEMNASIDKQSVEKQVDNVQTVLAVEHDPLIPDKVDLIFSVNAYHHLKDRTAYFQNAARYLKPGGRVAIIDFRKGMFRHYTEQRVLLQEFKAAGYGLDKTHGFLPRQHFLVFSQPKK